MSKQVVNVSYVDLSDAWDAHVASMTLKDIARNSPSFRMFCEFLGFTPPKEKVKLYKWAFAYPKGVWNETVTYFADEVSVRVAYDLSSSRLFRLDKTMIEVDAE